MSLFWYLLWFSWFGAASLQYVSKNGLHEDSVLDFPDPTVEYPIPYMNFYNLRNDKETYQNGPLAVDSNQFYRGEVDTQASGLQRKRRTAVMEENNDRPRHWMPNLIDTDKTAYLRGDENNPGSPFILQGYAGAVEANGSDSNLLNTMDKKSFSPWGGKRDREMQMPYIEHTWSWKRAANLREPTMPKRVRFSPWGGKRSGQIVYKPGSKNSKIILSQALPELTRFVSNYLPNSEKYNMAGFEVIPSSDKRNPIRVLAMRTKLDGQQVREGMPLNALFQALPKLFKPGHPYLDVNLKKDGKRKVKFSAWGGKRSPPIIGPIWTPPPQNIKETTLDAILLIRNNHRFDDKLLKVL